MTSCLWFPPSMSVYDPYYGRYSGYGGSMYRAPSTRSYYSYAASPYSAYAASSPYSTYAASNPYSTYGDSTMTGGTVSQRIYFSLNGKLIRSYKIRNYRVRHLTSVRAGSESRP